MKQLTYLVLKEVRQRRWIIIGYSLVAIGFLWLYIGIYPTFAKETAKFDELLKAYPKALLEAFNIEKLQLSTLEGYISAEHFSFVWPLMAILLTVSTAGVSLAGEIEKTTMAMLLSLPVSRAKLYAAKYIAGAKVVGIFTLASAASIIPLALVSDIAINQANVWRTVGLSYCFAMAVFSLAFMVSAAVKERSRVYMVIGGLLITMYVANIVSNLVSSLENAQYLSFFHYYSPDKALVKGELSLQSIAIFIGVSAVAYLVGLLIFTKRDISV